MSDGKPHTRQAWKWLAVELFAFGGATEASELYKGWYRDRDTGEPVSDQSRKYFLALPREQVAQLRKLLRRACGVFQQKCIYLSVAGKVEFVEGRSNAP